MSRAEFEMWRDKFDREPWGVVADDRRHSTVCSLLTGLINSWAKEPLKIKHEDFLLSRTQEAVTEIEELLYIKVIDNSKPWLDGRSQEQIALDGQAHFQKLVKRYGR